MIDIIIAAYRCSRISELLHLAIQNVRKTTARSTPRGEQAGAEHQAQLQKAKRDGEAAAAVMPYRLIR